MNVYDFDKTIYKKDSTLEFFKFSIKKDFKLLRYFPLQLSYLILFKIKITSKETFKEKFYSFLNGIEDVDHFIELFWNEEIKNIEQWYLTQQNPDDLIISASPTFLLKDICRRINIENLIASEVNKKSGKLESKNCYGIEKVHRFKQEYGAKEISKFYSDSISDLPMGKIANEFFLVKKGNIEKWSN